MSEDEETKVRKAAAQAQRDFEQREVEKIRSRFRDRETFRIYTRMLLSLAFVGVGFGILCKGMDERLGTDFQAPTNLLDASVAGSYAQDVLVWYPILRAVGFIAVPFGLFSIAGRFLSFEAEGNDRHERPPSLPEALALFITAVGTSLMPNSVRGSQTGVPADPSRFRAVDPGPREST